MYFYVFYFFTTIITNSTSDLQYLKNKVSSVFFPFYFTSFDLSEVIYTHKLCLQTCESRFELFTFPPQIDYKIFFFYLIFGDSDTLPIYYDAGILRNMSWEKCY